LFHNAVNAQQAFRLNITGDPTTASSLHRIASRHEKDTTMAIRRKVSLLTITFGIGAVSMASGPGTASAQPDITALVNTTCSYGQIMAALNTEAPDVARQLTAYPMAQARLQQFLALPIDQREQMAQSALATNPQLQQQNGEVLVQVASTCSNY
jgi:hemophore-related protein